MKGHGSLVHEGQKNGSASREHSQDFEGRFYVFLGIKWKAREC